MIANVRCCAVSRKKQLFENVNRWTRAGKKGKYINCPHCFETTLVWHFAWSALKCAGCKGYVEKHRWIINNVSQKNKIAVTGKIAEALASSKILSFWGVHCGSPPDHKKVIDDSNENWYLGPPNTAYRGDPRK